MASASITMSDQNDDTQLINYLVRMVVPLRREFGRQLNVQQFMHDFAYAREVLEQARTSADPRLVEYARYIEGRSRSPRIADKPSASDIPVADTVPGIQAAKTPAATAPVEPSADELRERVLKKYTTGLR